MRYVYAAGIVLITAAVLVLMGQNIESVTVSFVTIRITMPLFLLKVLVYFLGMVTGGSLVGFIPAACTGAPPGAQHPRNPRVEQHERRRRSRPALGAPACVTGVVGFRSAHASRREERGKRLAHQALRRNPVAQLSPR